MDYNATLIGQLVFVWMIIATTLAYKLAIVRLRRPAPTVFINFVLAWLPPLSIISLWLLSMKPELTTDKEV